MLIILAAGVSGVAAIVSWWAPGSRLLAGAVALARAGTKNGLVLPVSTWARRRVVWAVAGAAAAAVVTAPLVLAGGLHGSSGPTRLAEWGWVVPWAVMVALLGLVDLAERVVPTLLVRAATGTTAVLAALVCSLTGDWGPLVRGGACALASWAVFATWAVLAPGSLGFGDARMACLVALGAGAASPAGTVVALACSVMTAGAWGRLREGARPGLVRGRRPVALGPLLALSGLAVAVTGAR